jgi:Uma2 family endonuclease
VAHISRLPLELARQERRRPAWELSLLYPDQGEWTEDDYLDLESERLIEYTEGRLEFLPTPTKTHQWIVLLLVNALREFVRNRNLGQVVHAPFPVRVGRARFREPDVAYLSSKHGDLDGERFWGGADLVMEVVSPNKPARDRVKKRREYAAARVPEYWIVDPARRRITVLRLANHRYAVHGEFGDGEMACSALLDGFQVTVTDALDAR